MNIEVIKRKLYKSICEQFQCCLKYVLKERKGSRVSIKLLNSSYIDFSKLNDAVFYLINDGVDFWDVWFKNVEQRPIYRCLPVGWDMIKFYYNELKKNIKGE